MGPPLRQIKRRVRFLRRGRTLAGPLRVLCHIGAHPHPPRMCSAPSPLEGEGSGVQVTAPLSPARQSQAQKGNRTGYNLGKTRAQWPGKKC